jgi:hypothetical protein
MSGVFVLLLDGRQVQDQATGSNLCTGYMCMRNVRVFARIFMDSYLGARKVAVCVNRARVILLYRSTAYISSAAATMGEPQLEHQLEQLRLRARDVSFLFLIRFRFGSETDIGFPVFNALLPSKRRRLILPVCSSSHQCPRHTHHPTFQHHSSSRSCHRWSLPRNLPWFLLHIFRYCIF